MAIRSLTILDALDTPPGSKSDLTMPKAKSWRAMGARRGMRFLAGLLGPREFVRPRLAESPEEFIQRHHLEDAVKVARELAVAHFGDRFTTFRCILHVEDDWQQYVEVEVGAKVPREDFLSMRDRYLDAFEAVYPEMNWDEFHLSVRYRESAD